MTDPALTKTEILTAITSANEDAKERFMSHFAKEVDAFSATLTRVHASVLMPECRAGRRSLLRSLPVPDAPVHLLMDRPYERD